MKSEAELKNLRKIMREESKQHMSDNFGDKCALGLTLLDWVIGDKESSGEIEKEVSKAFDAGAQGNKTDFEIALGANVYDNLDGLLEEAYA